MEGGKGAVEEAATPRQQAKGRKKNAPAALRGRRNQGVQKGISRG